MTEMLDAVERHRSASNAAMMSFQALQQNIQAVAARIAALRDRIREANTAQDESYFLADDLIFSNVWLAADYAMVLGGVLFVLFFALAFKFAKRRRAQKLAEAERIQVQPQVELTAKRHKKPEPIMEPSPAPEAVAEPEPIPPPPPAPEYVEFPPLPAATTASWSDSGELTMPFNVDIEEVQIGGQKVPGLVAIVSVLDGISPLAKEASVADAYKLFSNGVSYRFQEERMLPAKSGFDILNPGTGSNLLLTVAISNGPHVLDVLGQCILPVRSFNGKKADKGIQLRLPLQQPLIMPYKNENAHVEYRASNSSMNLDGHMVVRIASQKQVAFRKGDLPFDLYKFLGGVPADENKMVNAAKNQIAVKVLCRAELPDRRSDDKGFYPMWMILAENRIKLQAMVEGQPLHRSIFKQEDAQAAQATSVSLQFDKVAGFFCFRIPSQRDSTGSVTAKSSSGKEEEEDDSMMSAEMLDSAVQCEQLPYCVEIQVDGPLEAIQRSSGRLQQIAEEKVVEGDARVSVSSADLRRTFKESRIQSVGSITDYKRVHIAFRNLNDYRAWVYVLLSKINVRNFVSNEQLAKKNRWTWAGIEFPLLMPHNKVVGWTKTSVISDEPTLASPRAHTPFMPTTPGSSSASRKVFQTPPPSQPVGETPAVRLSPPPTGADLSERHSPRASLGADMDDEADRTEEA